jgi:hypothetical protein
MLFLEVDQQFGFAVDASRDPGNQIKGIFGVTGAGFSLEIETVLR